MAKQDNAELKKYELMLILKSTLPDADRKNVLSKIKDLITASGGSINEENAWGKRALAYEIKKQKEGYYIIYNVLMSATFANDLKRALNINSDVLRYMLRALTSFEKISTPVMESRER